MIFLQKDSSYMVHLLLPLLDLCYMVFKGSILIIIHSYHRLACDIAHATKSRFHER